MYVVIGAAGQVGQEFARLVAPNRVRLLEHGDVDVTEPSSLDDCLSGAAYSAIVNLAAFHDVNGCEGNPERAHRVNAVGAANVARVARRHGCKAVFFSSDYVFGQDHSRQAPYLERDSPAPVNVYGASKLAGENHVRDATPDHLIVRTSSLFGATTSRKGWTFPEMIVRRALAGEPLRVVDDQHMAPTFTRDLVTTVISLMDAGATGTVHVTNEGGCSWHEFAKATLEIAGVDHPIEPVSSSEFPTPARRPAYSRLESERMAEWNLPRLRHWRLALRAYLQEKGLAS